MYQARSSYVNRKTNKNFLDLLFFTYSGAVVVRGQHEKLVFAGPARGATEPGVRTPGS